MDLLPVLDSVWSEHELQELEALTREQDEGSDGDTVTSSVSGDMPGKGGASKAGPEQKKKRRAERNREHARRSRARKKLMVDNVERSIQVLKQENEKLRSAISSQLGEKGKQELRRIDVLTRPNEEGEYTTGEEEGGTSSEGESLLSAKTRDSSKGLTAPSAGESNQLLADSDYSLLVALKKGRQNFLVTDPRLPDNPIVFASGGFMTLTGYAHEEVLGRNCRFLQGPDTDPVDVDRIRDAVVKGTEISVCLLNYKKDNSTFWNQFFITPLRDPTGQIVNFVGVQQVVTPQVAQLLREQARGNLKAYEEEKNLIGRGERLRTEMLAVEDLDIEALLAQAGAMVS